MSILRLPPLLVNQIAAGEVIERPASVVKELIENAIDAGATQIEVVIERGGKELIRVSDDGRGIAADELPLALEPHSTSKIAAADDLIAIATMGFRGEALASIASVSRIAMLSRTSEQDGAALIEGEGAELSPPRPAGGAKGTAVTVRNLFFNTPARRKFLKTDQTEAGRVADIVEGLAMAHPQIGFALLADGRKRVDIPPGRDPRRRALDLLGPELEPELLEVQADERGIRLWGLAGRPGIARATARHQRIYLNGRMIQDRSISHAIKEAYRGLIEPTRHPTIVLFLSMDPAQVDVNVHPAKAEVRFRNQAAVHGVVYSAVRAALQGADLAPALDLTRGSPAALALAAPPLPPPEFGSGLPASAHGAPQGGTSSPPADAHTRAFVDYFRRLDPQQKGFVYSEMKEALARESPEMLEEQAESESPRADPEDESLPTLRAAQEILQVHSSFIVTQDEDGLVIIDQHALHERVMFEKLKDRVERGPLESQRLLMPAAVEVDAAQIEALQSLQRMLEKLGIEAEQMGPTSVAVHAFTSLLFERRVEPASFMRELLEKAYDQRLPSDPEAALHEVLDMMACKAAIKAGDRLSPKELEELLAYRDQIERSSNCPHGRPTSLRLSIRELEKQFGRR